MPCASLTSHRLLRLMRNIFRKTRRNDPSDLDGLLTTAIADNVAPFIVAAVANADGVKWQGAAGGWNGSYEASQDTVFRIFSMTKGVCAVAAMTLIEKNRLRINDPVKKIIPDFERVQVLAGFKDGRPILRAPKRDVTVCDLATHMSGFANEAFYPRLAEYVEKTGHPSILTGRREAFYIPLADDPGKEWRYGIGPDWLGRVIEMVDGRPIDRYCTEEIFEPLHMHDTVFEKNAGIKDRIAPVKIRGQDGSFSDIEFDPPAQPQVYCMGQALYSTARDYIKLLRMLLCSGELDGQRILQPESVKNLMRNRIGRKTVNTLQSGNPSISNNIALYPEYRKNHSLGFIRMDLSVPGARSKGAQGWAGVCNTHFWLDPIKDLASVVMAQTLPFFDKCFMDFFYKYERAVYKSF